MTVPLRRGHRRMSIRSVWHSLPLASASTHRRTTGGEPVTGSTTLTREPADLIGSLRRHRSFLRSTVRDLTDEQAMRRPTTSALTPARLIEHMAATEAGWMRSPKAWPRRCTATGPPCRDPAPDLRYDRSAEDVPEIFVGLWTGWALPPQRPDGRRSLLAGRDRGGAGHHHLVAAAAAAGHRGWTGSAAARWSGRRSHGLPPCEPCRSPASAALK